MLKTLRCARSILRWRGEHNYEDRRFSFAFLIHKDSLEPKHSQGKGDFVAGFVFFFPSTVDASLRDSVPWTSLNTALFWRKIAEIAGLCIYVWRNDREEAWRFSSRLSKWSATEMPTLLDVSQISTHRSTFKSKLGREFTLKPWSMCESWGNFGTWFPINF